MRPVPSRLVLLLCASLLAGGCSRLADALFLSPERTNRQSPGAFGLVYEDLEFPAADRTRLHGWWLPGESGRPTVLLLHDGTGNVGTRVDLLRQLREWLGVGAFIFDYRGFGRSAGTRSDAGMADDVAGARRLLRSRGWDRDGLVLYGRGLGASLAAGSGVEDPPAGVVLEAAFPDLERVQRARRPVLAALLSPWLTGRFDTLAAVSRLTVPALFLHGDRDRRVPIGLGWQVFDACRSPKRFRTITGANHRDTAFSGGETYWGAWRDFLGEVQGNGRPAAPP